MRSVATKNEERQSNPRHWPSPSTAPTSSIFQSVSEEKQSSPPLRQTLEQPQLQQQHALLDARIIAPIDTAASTNMMAPVTRTTATREVAAAAATSMRSPPLSQSIPFRDDIQTSHMPRATSSTLSPTETLLWSNRVNSSTAPTTMTLPTANSWSPSTLSHQNSAGVVWPGTTLARHLFASNEAQKSAARHFHQQSPSSVESAHQLVVGPRQVAAMNEERQSITSFLQPVDSLTSQLASWLRHATTTTDEPTFNASYGQSTLPAHATTSALAFLYQQQQQRQQRRNQHMAVPLVTASNALTALPETEANREAATIIAAGANMRSAMTIGSLPFEGRMSNNPMLQHLPTITSPLPSLSTMTASLHPLPESWSSSPLPQQSNTGMSPPRATLVHGQAGCTSLPSLDNAPPVSMLSTQSTQRASWNEPSIPSATTEEAASFSAAATSNTEGTRTTTAPVMTLPATLTGPMDSSHMSGHQAFLRCHIQVFCASIDDVTAPMRGRIKRIQIGQVGIQCCHCAHLPRAKRLNGAVYFPAATLGTYQASLNVGAMHLQCGRCPHMPEAMKQRFVELMPTKNVLSTVGRKYWAERAVEMFGLVDTEEGIFVGSRSTPMAQGIH